MVILLDNEQGFGEPTDGGISIPIDLTKITQASVEQQRHWWEKLRSAITNTPAQRGIYGKLLYMNRTITKRPSITGRTAIPGQGGGHGDGWARGAKNVRATAGHPKTKTKLTLATYNGSTIRQVLFNNVVEISSASNRVAYLILKLTNRSTVWRWFRYMLLRHRNRRDIRGYLQSSPQHHESALQRCFGGL